MSEKTMVQVDDVVREATVEEKANLQAFQDAFQQQKLETEKAIAKKTAVLAKLGLTADEAAALLG